MYKAKWGTKRTCPKCATRFYDLGNDDPIVCIECAHEWKHEPVLKTKQPVIAQPSKPEPVKDEAEDGKDDNDLPDLDDDDDIELDDDDDDDVLGDISLDDDDDDVSKVIDTSSAGDDDS